MLQGCTLVWKLRGGDEQALRRIYQKYKNELMTAAVLLLAEPHTAEEILHDAFVSFAAGIREFHQCWRLRSHLIACIAETVRERLRLEMYQVREVERTGLAKSGSSEQEQPAAPVEQPQLLVDALAELPAAQREAIILRLQCRMSFRKIAKLQRVSISMARARYRNGFENLRSFLSVAVRE